LGPVVLGLICLGSTMLVFDKDQYQDGGFPIPLRLKRDIRGDYYNDPDLRVGGPLRRASEGIVQGAITGCALGLFSGTVLASHVARQLQRGIVNHRISAFFDRDLETEAAETSASSASLYAAMTPALALALPVEPIMVLLIGAMTSHGVTLGPELTLARPDLFWGLSTSTFIGAVVLCLIAWPLIKISIALSALIPANALAVLILAFSCVCAYAGENNTGHLYILAAFGCAGLIMIMLNFDIWAFLLGFVMSPALEGYLGETMAMSEGNPFLLFTRPLPAVLLAVSMLFVIASMWLSLRREPIYGPYDDEF
jgi:putative tricarboxylic transport membrane protein